MFRFSLAGAAAVAACALLLAGCNSDKKDEYKPVPENPPEVKKVDLHEHGPHEGHVIDLGDHDYRAEFVMDADRNVTIYLLQHDSDEPLAVDPQGVSLQLEADEKATPVELEPVAADGKASEFKVPAAKLPPQVKSEEDLHGELKVTVDGKTFTGALEHDHHD